MKKIKKILSEAEVIKNEVKRKIISYIAAAFGLVAGLAWNDAIKSIIDYLFPHSSGGLLAKIVYAFILTIIVAVLLFYLERFILRSKINK